MGLPPVKEFDESAEDLLAEFMNVIVGRAISRWDKLGLPVRFSPPISPTPADLKTDQSEHTQIYLMPWRIARKTKQEITASPHFSQD